MKRPPLQVPTAVRVGSGIAVDGRRLRCRGWTAGWECSRSATRSPTAAASCSGASRCSRGRCGRRAASGCRTPAGRWTAPAPPTSCASRSRSCPRRPATTSAASTSASTTCGRPTGIPRRSRGTRAPRSRFLRERCDRVLACTIPRDLGRPRAGRPVDAANEVIAAAGVLLVDLREFKARNHVMVDAVHPTAFGQVAIAERALERARRGRDGRRAPAVGAAALGDHPLAAAAGRRDLRLPAGQAGGPDRDRPPQAAARLTGPAVSPRPERKPSRQLG